MTFGDRLYIILVIAMAIAYTLLTGGRAIESLRISLSGPSAQSSHGGQARRVDMQVLEDRIRRGTLSDHEARHYRRVEENSSDQKRILP